MAAPDFPAGYLISQNNNVTIHEVGHLLELFTCWLTVSCLLARNGLPDGSVNEDSRVHQSANSAGSS